MSDLFEVTVLENKSGHKDLIISFTGLVDLTLDTYYFAIAVKPDETFKATKTAIAQLLSYWQATIQNSLGDQTIYLPIDFSDEYTGCFKIHNRGETLMVTYGFSSRQGYSVSPIDPNDYSTTVTDFQQDVHVHVEVDKESFICSITSQVNKLRSES
jgi:hypothetical protein